MMFEINKLYRRSELHDQYGGNRQGGIANCANHPIIFIFTGKSGKGHGVITLLLKLTGTY